VRYCARREKKKLELVGYNDSDMVGDVDDRKSASGMIYFLSSGVIFTFRNSLIQIGNVIISQKNVGSLDLKSKFQPLDLNPRHEMLLQFLIFYATTFKLLLNPRNLILSGKLNEVGHVKNIFQN